MPSQTTEADLMARMHEANANSADTFNWPGTCNGWVAQQWNPLPFFRTGDSKCFSSGLNSQNEYGYYCPASQQQHGAPTLPLHPALSAECTAAAQSTPVAASTLAAAAACHRPRLRRRRRHH